MNQGEVIDLATSDSDGSEIIDLRGNDSGDDEQMKVRPSSALEEQLPSAATVDCSMEPTTSSPTLLVCRMCDSEHSSASALRRHLEVCHLLGRPVECSCGSSFRHSAEVNATSCCQQFDQCHAVNGLNLMENFVSMIVSHSQANGIDEVNERLENAISKFASDDAFSGSLDDHLEDIDELWADEEASLDNGFEETVDLSELCTSPKFSADSTIPDAGHNVQIYNCPVTDCRATTGVFSTNQQAALVKHVVSEHMNFDLQKCIVCERSNSTFHFRLYSTFFEHHARCHSQAAKKARPLTLTVEQQQRLTDLVKCLDKCLSEKAVIEDIYWNNVLAILRNDSS